ncbi:MAG: PTS sugar transporter subunit IIA [Pelolinea sp.]|nr:PTS sugar transporter subunit IIA [Pelolinea sp.]
MSEILSLQTIRLQVSVASKEDAIRQAGELLVQGGCVLPAYIDGMLAREKSMSTFVGNGVAIPHGQFDDLSLVKRTGISVLQVPAGIEWEPGNIAYLLVGIAATSNEHIKVLANLAKVVEDENNARHLAQTTDPEIVLKYLNPQPRKKKAEASE